MWESYVCCVTCEAHTGFDARSCSLKKILAAKRTQKSRNLGHFIKKINVCDHHLSSRHLKERERERGRGRE
jgi:hypothetical protein